MSTLLTWPPAALTQPLAFSMRVFSEDSSRSGWATNATS
jgi:hypothetical protein